MTKRGLSVIVLLLFLIVSAACFWLALHQSPPPTPTLPSSVTDRILTCLKRGGQVTLTEDTMWCLRKAEPEESEPETEPVEKKQLAAQ